jgi:hypothetical protein
MAIRTTFSNTSRLSTKAKSRFTLRSLGVESVPLT